MYLNRISASAECVRRNYDRVMLNIKKGTKSDLQKIASLKNLTLTSYIKEAIRKKYHADTGLDLEL